VLGTGLILVMLTLAVVRFPRQLYPVPAESSLEGLSDKEKLDAQNAQLTLQNSLRGTLVQGVGGLLVLITASLGGYFTLQQVKVSRDGQLTDRFTKATDQLGHDKDDVRIGGIFTLERIARYSPVDRRAIVEVLNAFVRRRSPRDAKSAGSEDPLPLPQRLADVQAAVGVLSQPIFGAQAVRLPLVDLRNAALLGAHLAEAVMRSADLTRSDLREAVLRGARLEDAILERAFLNDADLQGADLRDADLQGADLRGADLQGADLRGADLRGALLHAADLRGAKFEETRLEGAYDSDTTHWPEGFDRTRAPITRDDELAAREPSPQR
jgi:hypothetical protein